jgi:hypothetical protein
MFENLQVMLDKLKEKIFSWVESVVVMLPNFLIALAVVSIYSLVIEVSSQYCEKDCFKNIQEQSHC